MTIELQLDEFLTELYLFILFLFSCLFRVVSVTQGCKISFKFSKRKFNDEVVSF